MLILARRQFARAAFVKITNIIGILVVSLIKKTISGNMG